MWNPLCEWYISIVSYVISVWNCLPSYLSLILNFALLRRGLLSWSPSTVSGTLHVSHFVELKYKFKLSFSDHMNMGLHWLWNSTTWIQALASHGYWLAAWPWPSHLTLRKPVFFCVNGRQWHPYLLNTHSLLELCVCSFILSHSVLQIALSCTYYCSRFTNKKAKPGQLK